MQSYRENTPTELGGAGVITLKAMPQGLPPDMQSGVNPHRPAKIGCIAVCGLPMEASYQPASGRSRKSNSTAASAVIGLMRANSSRFLPSWNAKIDRISCLGGWLMPVSVVD